MGTLSPGVDLIGWLAPGAAVRLFPEWVETQGGGTAVSLLSRIRPNARWSPQGGADSEERAKNCYHSAELYHSRNTLKNKKKENNEKNTASRIIVRSITWSSFGISTAAVKPERGRKGLALTW